MGLVASEAAFSGACDHWLAALRVYLRQNRDFVVDYLTENFPAAKFTIPQATYLQWIDFGEYVKSGRLQETPFEFFLNRAKVALSAGQIFDEGRENFVRLNFAMPRPLVRQGLERMSQAMK